MKFLTTLQGTLKSPLRREFADSRDRYSHSHVLGAIHAVIPLIAHHQPSLIAGPRVQHFQLLLGIFCQHLAQWALAVQVPA